MRWAKLPHNYYTNTAPLSHLGAVRLGHSYLKIWSGARDLNPGPHGPELWAVSSRRPETFELYSKLQPTTPNDD